MPRRREQYYAILKTRHDKTGSTRVDVVEGLARAQHVTQLLDSTLTPDEQRDGWGHYIDECPRGEGRAWVASHRRRRLGRVVQIVAS
jgi:hypothetical protein